MSSSALRLPLSSTVPAALLALTGAVALGLAMGGIVPTPFVLPVLAIVPAVFAVVVVLLPARKVIPVTAAACILATALASSRFPTVVSLLSVGRFLFPVLLIIMIFRAGVRFRQGPSINRMWALGAAVITAAGLSITTSKYPALSLVKTLSLAVVLAAVIALVQWSTTRQISLRRPVTLILSLLSLSNIFLLPAGGFAYSGNRFRGWTINPNTLGMLCALSLPLLVAELITARGRYRKLLLLGIMLIVVTLLLSGSRGSTVAAVLGTAAVLRSARITRSPGFPIIVIATLLLTPWALQSGSDSSLVEGVNRPGGSARDEVWDVAFAEIKQRPIVGAGFATTKERLAHREFGGTFIQFNSGHIHNSYLEASVELGLLGALPLIFTGIFAITYLARPAALESMWAAGVAVAGATVSLFETGALTAGATVFFPFWLAIGVLVMSGAHAPETMVPTPAANIRRISG